MTNREVAWILENIADMLQIKQDNPYRIRAYRKAADSIYHLEEDLRDLYRRGALAQVEGVGKAVREIIEEILNTGECSLYHKLEQEVPRGLLDMLSIPGLGFKGVQVIYSVTGIDSVEDLAAAARKKQLRELPGFGAKTEEKILKGIAIANSRLHRSTLGLTLPLAEELVRTMQDVEGVVCVSPVGSIRRAKPLVGDIDVLVASTDFSGVFAAVESSPMIKQITEKSDDSIKGYIKYDIPFEVILVRPEDYYHSLVWTTGSKEHRKIVFDGVDRNRLQNLQSEQEVYEKLGMQYIPPEMRENRGEIEKAKTFNLPDIIRHSDIKGDLHIHTTWSDGAHSLEDMAVCARKMGYSYLVITDHSQSLHISGGLSEKRLAEQGKIIAEFNRQLDGFKVLRGTEVDILKDGSLDYRDTILEELDVVVASVHSSFNIDKDQQTERILRVIQNPHVDIVGHLTGRLLNRRAAYEIDVDRILCATAKYGKVLEINSHPDRLDIDEEIARRAAGMGIKMAINSDAHDKNGMYFIHFGVKTARRAWLRKEDVINTWDIDDIIAYFNKGKC